MLVNRANPDRIEPNLLDWKDMPDESKRGGLLLGNGASRAIWDKFAYNSLFDTARSVPQSGLSKADVAVFDAFQTKNFETVLQSLATAMMVMTALQSTVGPIQRRYNHVRSALVRAVHQTHVPHDLLSPNQLAKIAAELKQFEYIYSTNYDLILYWAMMHDGPPEDFKDFFFGPGPCFDVADSDVWGKPTKVLFVHGGLHLFLDDEGRTCKLRAESGALLEQFARQQSVPVFVSEGTSKDKLSVIYGSDYLSFAYSRLAAHGGPLTVLGHSLADTDRHIVDALRRAKTEKLAIGIHAVSNEAIIENKAHFLRCFPRAEMWFFDSKTHPLTSPDMKVCP